MDLPQHPVDRGEPVHRRERELRRRHAGVGVGRGVGREGEALHIGRPGALLLGARGRDGFPVWAVGLGERVGANLGGGGRVGLDIAIAVGKGLGGLRAVGGGGEAGGMKSSVPYLPVSLSEAILGSVVQPIQYEHGQLDLQIIRIRSAEIESNHKVFSQVYRAGPQTVRIAIERTRERLVPLEPRRSRPCDGTEPTQPRRVVKKCGTTKYMLV